MQRIYYLGYYNCAQNAEEIRLISPATVSKIDSITHSLNELGCPVEIISAGKAAEPQIYNSKVLMLSDKKIIKFFYTVGGNSYIRKTVNSLAYVSQMLHFFLSIPKGSIVIIYHVRKFMRIVQWIKKHRDIRIILEIEEIYGEVTNDVKSIQKERTYFQYADAYLFPTQLLDQSINTTGKPSAIIHGTYQVEPNLNVKFNDGKIHVVYAGTLDAKKGGAYIAANSALALDDRYHLHILGFGTDEEIDKINKLIADITPKTTATITYDGVFTGEDYIRFLQSCHIGLSTQTPEGSYNDTSFPSKVLSYLANGLHVVSVKIPVLEQSAVNDLLYYYEGETPEAIGNAIKRIRIEEPYDSRARIQELEKKFEEDLKNVLADLNQAAKSAV